MPLNDKGRSDKSDRPFAISIVARCLENYPQRELTETPLVVLPIIGKSAEAALLTLYNYGGPGREQSNVRVEPVIVHVGMIEDVESFGPQLKLQAFSDWESLAHGQIKTPGAGSVELIPL